MSDLVQHRCQVLVNPAEQAMFFHFDPQEDGALFEGSEDPEVLEMMKAWEGTVRCGLPAYDFVLFPDGEFWMCPEHYGRYTEASEHENSHGLGCSDNGDGG